MKILYVRKSKAARTGDDTEGHIEAALFNQGHKVECWSEDMGLSGMELRANANDLMLFHHTGRPMIEHLKRISVPTAMWYFDKAWNGRELVLEDMLPHVDFPFMTDGDFAAAHPTVQVLRQGVGEANTALGKPTGTKSRVAFFGSVYGQRAAFCETLKKRYGADFVLQYDKHGKDLADAIASTDIVIAPYWPATDRYWSNRIYLMLGAGACLVHPHLAGLDSEYTPDIHYASYKSDSEMLSQVSLLLKDPWARKQLSLNGHAHTLQHHTIGKRVHDLLAYVQAHI